jgi:hypothetical protein
MLSLEVFLFSDYFFLFARLLLGLAKIFLEGDGLS